MAASSSTSAGSGFFILPFAIDGQPEGRGFWRFADLSNSSLKLSSDYLTRNGDRFDASWPENFSHIRTKLTSAAGIALVTFYVHGKIVTSAILLGGPSSSAQEEAARMFVESLRNSLPPPLMAPQNRAFEALFQTTDRPLMAVVAFPESTVSDEDHAAVRKLSLHLAAAFFAARS